MKKPIAFILTAILVLLGLSLMVAGAMSGKLSAPEYRYFVTYGLGLFCAVLLISALAFPIFSEKEYKKVLRTILLLLTLGMYLQFMFFGIMWMFLGTMAIRILLTILLSLYGLALIMAGVVTHMLAQNNYRPFLYNFFQELPYAYYRYRT